MARIEKLLAENHPKRKIASSELSNGSHYGLDVPAGRIEAEAKCPPEAGAPDLATLGRIYCAGYRLGDINLFHGVPFLSRDGQQWIGLRSAEDSQEGFGSPLWHNQRQAWPSLPTFVNVNPSQWDMAALPARESVEKHFDYYLTSSFSDAFPIADKVLFPLIIERAYRHDTASAVMLATKACIFSFIAFTSMAGHPADEGLPPIDLEHCIAAAQLLVPDILNARPSIEVVDAMMMFAVYQFGCGNVHTVDIILALASRFLFMLGAHLYPGTETDSLPSHALNLESRRTLHLRDVFWICYGLDKEITFRTGRPPIINDTACDLTFPKYYWQQIQQDFQGAPRLPSDLRLTLIKSKAYDKLYSPNALRKADAEMLKDIRELDEMLENWRQSLPPRRRPTLSYSQQRGHVPNDDSFDIVTFLIRLEYHHCMTTIHQASSRCTNWAGNHRTAEGLGSSLDLALESSRSLLSYFTSVEHHLTPHIFWVVIFYPLSATLNLFCNIMLNPASAAASSDLKILQRNIVFMDERKASDQQLSAPQLSHLARVRQAAEEVLRLAQSVVLQSQTSG
ncbi:hypothetical protein LTR67_007732 [Exophiala xenobiotica]